ncbi:hypothetical protein CKO38_11495 [Rhodospirillum rubrum]|uniref:hypothetical protein n=1 Tax=Rhodospirillum rubrum TaxID=1085 RepID=UPI0019069D5E|nr:hypothetical protein [Rhodospirillum rubrum]MBK1665400.1 hypothetical protein [Rhodospirillum rubrum]MBK1677278.1 hypothetical protein [Rhodospirillum rubrum]
MSDYPKPRVANIVRAAGGQIVGRTRLQKVAYLSQLAGFPSSFHFEYYHYGPYSEELAAASRIEDAFGLLSETESTASWGGKFSIFKDSSKNPEQIDKSYAKFAAFAASRNAIELELAATAAFLAKEERCEDPWGETARRKPEKVGDGRLEGAKALYKELLSFNTPTPLPNIA